MEDFYATAIGVATGIIFSTLTIYCLGGYSNVYYAEKEDKDDYGEEEED